MRLGSLLLIATLVPVCHPAANPGRLHLVTVRLSGSSVHLSVEIEGAPVLAISCEDGEVVERGINGFSGDFGGVFSANITVVLGNPENETVEFSVWKSGGRLSVEVVGPGENGTVLGVRDFSSPGESSGRIRVSSEVLSSEASVERVRPRTRALIVYVGGAFSPEAAPGAVDGLAVRSPVTGFEGVGSPVVPVVSPSSDSPQDIASAVVSASADAVSLGGLKLSGKDVVILTYVPDVGPDRYGEAAELLRSGGWPLSVLLLSEGEVPPVGLLRKFDGLVYLPRNPGGYQAAKLALEAASIIEDRPMVWAPVVPQGAGPWVDSAVATGPDWLVANLSASFPSSWQLESLASRLKGWRYVVNLSASVEPSGWLVPGEPAEVILTVVNFGNGTAAELSVWIEGSDGVSILGGVPLQIEALGPGEGVNGTFTLNLSEGENDVVITASYVDPTGVERREDLGPIGVRVPPCSELRVEVTGSLGQPISGAEVVLSDLSGVSSSGITGSDGSWTVKVPEGAYEILVRVGREADSDDVILRGGTSRTVTFQFDLVADLGGHTLRTIHLLAAASAVALLIGSYLLLARRGQKRVERADFRRAKPPRGRKPGGRRGEPRRRPATPRLGEAGEPRRP